MNSTEKARQALKKAYPSKKWAVKVDNMSDGQVAAVYLRLKAQHRL